MDISPVQLDRIGLMLERYAGLAMSAAERDTLIHAVAARFRASNKKCLESYISSLEDRSSADGELSKLIIELVVSESYFFRGEDHWQALKECVGPELIRDRRDVRRLRILCAGCASGEEPYTAAIVLAEHYGSLAEWQVEIVGIDISSAALDRAKTGRYTSWALRGLPERYRKRYFREFGNEFELLPEIRRCVRFEQRSLLDDSDSRFWTAGFDLILCRNVFIYFSPGAMRRAVDRFSQVLRPRGFLFLGHTETLRGVSRAFHLRAFNETFFYQLRPEGEPIDIDPLFGLWRDVSIAQQVEKSLPSFEREADDSWVETTQLVSERIRGLLQTVDPHSREVQLRKVDPLLDYRRAMELYQQERYAQLADLLAMPVAAGDCDAQLLLAATLTNGGPMDKAEETCRNLIATDEFNSAAHYLYALCREHAGDTERAEVHLQTAVYLEPEFAMPYLQLGRIAKSYGRFDRARRYLRSAQGLLPREDASRILLFGGGFSRKALIAICLNELNECGEAL